MEEGYFQFATSKAESPRYITVQLESVVLTVKGPSNVNNIVWDPSFLSIWTQLQVGEVE